MKTNRISVRDLIGIRLGAIAVFPPTFLTFGQVFARNQTKQTIKPLMCDVHALQGKLNNENAWRISDRVMVHVGSVSVTASSTTINPQFQQYERSIRSPWRSCSENTDRAEKHVQVHGTVA